MAIEADIGRRKDAPDPSGPRKRISKRTRGPYPRSPVPDNPAVEERQSRSFDLSIQGISNNAIAKLQGIDRLTVVRDIAMEAQRRAHERAGDREAAISRAVARYEQMIGDSTLRIQNIRADALSEKTWQGRSAHRAAIRGEIQLQQRAQRQAEEVQGLHVALHVDASTTNINVSSAQDNALAAFANVDPAMRSAMREQARADRQVELINVTPDPIV
jgi:hypothetical protein